MIAGRNQPADGRPTSPPAQPSAGHDAFISYSRRDDVFARRIHAALQTLGRDIWMDWEDIPPSSTWNDEIRAGIDNAHSFVFIISEHSVASPMCLRELEHAVAARKRIIPVVNGSRFSRPVPAALEPINWLFFSGSSSASAAETAELVAKSFEQCVVDLIAIIDTDLEHVRRHTRLLVRAREWESRDRNTSYTLHGQDLRDAEVWLAASADKLPNPSQLHRDYVLASRLGATRRQRRLMAGVIAALILTTGLAVTALALSWFADARRREAETQTRVAETQTEQALIQKTAAEQQRAEAQKQAAIALSRQLAAQSGALLARTPGSAPTAALLAAESLRRHPTLESDIALRRAIERLPDAIAHFSGEEPVTGVTFGGGSVIAIQRYSGISVVDMEERRTLAVFKQDEPGPSSEEDPDQPDDAPSPPPPTISPNDWTIAYLENETSLAIGDISAGRVVGRLAHDRSNALTAVSFAADSASLACVYVDGRIVIADVTDATVIATHCLGHTAERSAFTADGELALIIGRTERGQPDEVATGAATLIDLGAGKTIASWKGTGLFFDGQISADGRTVLLQDNQIRLFRPGESNPLLALTPAVLTHAALSRDGTRLAQLAMGPAAIIQVIDIPNRWIMGSFAATPTMGAFEFTPDGSMLLAVGLDGAIRRWSSIDGRELPALASDDIFGKPAVTPDGSAIATISKSMVTVSRLAATIGRPMATCIAYSRDGSLLATAATSLTIFETATERILREWPSDPVRGVFNDMAFTPKGDAIGTLSNKRIEMWDIAGGTTRRLASANSVLSPTSLAFNHDATRIAVGRSIIDVAAGRDLTTGSSFEDISEGRVPAIPEEVRTVAWSPDGSMLVKILSASPGFTVFSMPSGDVLRHVGAEDFIPIDIDFSPDGRFLAAASDNVVTDVDRVRVYRTDNWTVVFETITGVGNDVMVMDLGVGGLLAIARTNNSDRGIVRIFDTAAGVERSMIDELGSISDIAFSPDGRRLAVALGLEGHRVLVVPQDELLAEAARRTGRNLSRGEWLHYLPDEPYHETFAGLPRGRDSGMFGADPADATDTGKTESAEITAQPR